jgi:hypothetical protein
MADYAGAVVPVAPDDAPGFFHDNVSMLLERS